MTRSVLITQTSSCFLKAKTLVLPKAAPPGIPLTAVNFALFEVVHHRPDGVLPGASVVLAEKTTVAGQQLLCKKEGPPRFSSALVRYTAFDTLFAQTSHPPAADCIAASPPDKNGWSHRQKAAASSVVLPPAPHCTLLKQSRPCSLPS